MKPYHWPWVLFPILMLFCVGTYAQNDYPPPSYFPILPTGFGPVRLDRSISELPDVCPGLYATLDEHLNGLVYQFDTTYVHYDRPWRETIEISTVLSRFTSSGKLIDTKRYTEKAYLINDTVVEECVFRYLDPEQTIPLGRRVFEVEADGHSIIRRIRIYDPSFSTLSGLNPNSSVWDLYHHPDFVLVYSDDFTPYIEADGVRFYGFMSNIADDPEMQELIEEEYGKPPIRIKGSVIREQLPALLKEAPQEIEAALRLDKAEYIEISGDAPSTFKSALQQWTSLIDVPDDELINLPFYLDPEDISLTHPFPADKSSITAALIRGGYDRDGDGRITESDTKGVKTVEVTVVRDIYNRNYLSFKGLERFVDAEELRLSVDQDIWDSYIRSFVKYEVAGDLKDRVLRSRDELNEKLGYYEWTQSDGSICRLYRSSDAAPKNIMLSRTRPRFTLDLRPLKKLRRLKCNNMFLEHLLLDAPELETLECYDNYLADFNAATFPKLTFLDISHNQIQKLDISPLEKLEWLYCYSPVMADLIVTDQQFLDGVTTRREERYIHPGTHIHILETQKTESLPLHTAEGNIAFTDSVLKSFLIQDHSSIDTDEDGEISFQEAARINNLYLTDGSHFKNIHSTEDLQFFIGLSELVIEGDYEEEEDGSLHIYSEVREMDVSMLPDLTSLHIGLPLHQLTLGAKKHLQALSLSIGPDGMKELDISGCPELDFITITKKGHHDLERIIMTESQKSKVHFLREIPKTVIIVP